MNEVLSKLISYSTLYVFTNVGLEISECMVSLTNINNVIKKPTCGYQNCDTSQIMIHGGMST